MQEADGTRRRDPRGPELRMLPLQGQARGRGLQVGTGQAWAQGAGSRKQAAGRGPDRGSPVFSSHGQGSSPRAGGSCARGGVPRSALLTGSGTHLCKRDGTLHFCISKAPSPPRESMGWGSGNLLGSGQESAGRKSGTLGQKGQVTLGNLKSSLYENRTKCTLWHEGN